MTMDIDVQRFLEAKGLKDSWDLSDILSEFKMLSNADSIEFLKNPRTKSFTVVVDKRFILGGYKFKFVKK